jgi:adenylate kinase family enzyme
MVDGSVSPQRVHIIGGPGSGKSFLAHRLSGILDIPRFDLDDLFWDNASGYGTRAHATLRDTRLAEIVATPSWILEGVYYSWLGPGFARAELIVVLQPPVWLRHWRVIKRSVLRLSGLEHSKGESIRSVWDLLKYSHSYDSVHLPEAHAQILHHSRNVITASSGEEILASLHSWSAA